MAQGPTVAFGDVFIVRETEPALLCRIGDKFHWVAHSRLQPGSTVEHPGDFTAELDVEPGGRQSELLPETILPSQFADLLHKTAARPPEHRLMLAVLADAIRSYQKMLNRSDRRSRRLFRETEEWFTSNAATWPFSFVLICEKLALDPGYVRAGLHRWRSRHVALRDGVLDCASPPARDRFSASGDHGSRRAQPPCLACVGQRMPLRESATR